MGEDTALIRESIRVFFDKKKIQKEGDRFSQLNLLRRHKNICLHGSELATWPGVMAILAGIEMLGYFYKGGVFKFGSADKFTQFYTNFFFKDDHSPQKQTDAINLYKARCAMMHTYGLYTEDYDRRGNITKVYYFSINMNTTSPIIYQEPGTDNYVISIPSLDNEFDNAVDNYQEFLSGLLETDPADPKIVLFLEAYKKVKLIGDPKFMTPFVYGSTSGSALLTP